MISLISAPQDKQLRIIEINGGHGLRRRLMALGLHKSDVIQLESRSPLGGPILIRNMSSDTSLALGRGVAKKIVVEIVGE